MKITITINEKDYEIELTEAQIAEITKPKQYVIEYKLSSTFVIYEDSIGNNGSGDIFKYIDHGRYRHTQRQAELSLERNKRANRLEALAMSLPEWEEGGMCYTIRGKNNTWHVGYASSEDKYPEVVMMPKACAKKVCEILNSGEYEL